MVCEIALLFNFQSLNISLFHYFYYFFVYFNIAKYVLISVGSGGKKFDKICEHVALILALYIMMTGPAV